MAQQLRSCLRSCTNSTCEREGTTEKVAVHVCLSCCLLHDSLMVLVRGLDEVGGRLQSRVWPAKGALIGVRPAATHAIEFMPVNSKAQPRPSSVLVAIACLYAHGVCCAAQALHTLLIGRVHSSVICIAEDCRMC